MKLVAFKGRSARINSRSRLESRGRDSQNHAPQHPALSDGFFLVEFQLVLAVTAAGGERQQASFQLAFFRHLAFGPEQVAEADHELGEEENRAQQYGGE